MEKIKTITSPNPRTSIKTTGTTGGGGGTTTFDNFSYNNSTKIITLTIGGLTKTVDLTPLADELQNQINDIINGGFVKNVTLDTTVTPNTLNFTKNDGTILIVDLPSGGTGGGDTITNLETILTGTTLSTKITTDSGNFSDDVDLSSLSGGGTGGEPLYIADKPNIALNSTEDLISGTIVLNNGDGTNIPVYSIDTLDNKLDAKVDTLTFESSQEIQDNRITNAEEDLTDLQLKLESVILEQTNDEIVPLTTTPTSILTFPTVTNSGKYNGAMRANWTGSGLRSVTLTIYINGVATSKTTTESYTDNQTASLFTATPLDLVEGDIVEIYASSTTGSVEAISGALQLVLSNGTVDLTAYETVADHTADMATVNAKINDIDSKIVNAQLYKITQDNGEPLLKMGKEDEKFSFRQLVSAYGVSPESENGYTIDMVGIAMGSEEKNVSAQLAINANSGKMYSIHGVENPLDAGTKISKYRPVVHEDELAKMLDLSFDKETMVLTLKIGEITKTIKLN